MQKWLLIWIVFFPALGWGQSGLNQVDANGLKQGRWVKNFENGKKRYEGYFRDDKPIGTFTYYYEDLNGVISSKLVFLENENQVQASFFHRNQVLMGEGMMVNQKKQGPWKFYDVEKRLTSIEIFENGVRHGESRILFLDGKIAEEKTFEKGVPQGAFKEYFPSGKVRAEGTYLDGNYEGKITQYHTNGKVKTEGQYQHAVKQGKWVYYKENGGIAAQEIWELGKLVKQRVEDEQSNKP